MEKEFLYEMGREDGIINDDDMNNADIYDEW